MKEREYKELFLKLFEAKGEQEVSEIINNNDILKNPENWLPYGDDKSNFSVFDNQQPNAVPALIEKITNSIDSILLKKCKLQGIDPTNIKEEAPGSMSEAVEKFFNIRHGELRDITSIERKELSRNIQLIATGCEKTPDLLIFDNGEGQHPDDFSDTFLSIRKGNKNKIHFVQGQFNMGSTGAVVFCKGNRYQLIASKKNQDIFNKEKESKEENFMGFTLVRRHHLNEQENKEYKNSWYEYFAIRGHIPSFQIDEINIGLCNNVKFKSGAIVKLFSYDLPRGCGGTIRDGLCHELNQSLYKPALPFLLSDQRDKYILKKEGLKEITVSGNYIRLSNKNHLEVEPIYEELKDKKIGKIEIRAILLKKGEDTQQQSNRKQRFIGKKSVIFTINGQVHGFYGTSKIKEWGFPYLKESLLIHVDCSSVKTNFRQDLFMANRYNLKESEKLNYLIDKIKSTLKSSKLKELNEERKKQLLNNTGNKNEMNMIKNILSKHPSQKNLLSLLKNKGHFLKNKNIKLTSSSISKNISKKQKQMNDLQSKRFPSIFKIKLKEQEGKYVKSIPLGGKGIIQFETDVQNDYLQRPDEKGELILEILGRNSNSSENPNPKPSPNKVEDFFSTTISGPDDHSIKLTLEPTQKLSVGDEIKVNARLSSPEGDRKVLFYVRIIKKGGQKHTKNKEEAPENFDLPPLIMVIKNKDADGWIKESGEVWNENDWNEDSIIKIMTDEEQKIDAIVINLNSHTLDRYISKQKLKGERHLEAIKNKYISQMYLHGLFLFYAIQNNNEQDRKDNKELDSETLVSDIFKKYGEALLYLDTTEEVLKHVA